MANIILFSKTPAQKFIEQFLTQDDLDGISQHIASAYKATNELFRTTPALGAFLVGSDLRPHLLRVLTEYLLKQFADKNPDFSHEVRLNEARNCSHLRIYKNGLALTSHYMGAKCERPEARRALHEAHLAERNFSLFAFEENEPDICDDVGFAHIMHGGVVKPQEILINIPNRNQTGTWGSMQLALQDEDKAAVEQILDEPPYKLKKIIEELQSGKKIS